MLHSLLVYSSLKDFYARSYYLHIDLAYSSKTKASVRIVNANFLILCFNNLNTLAVLKLSSLGVPLLD